MNEESMVSTSRSEPGHQNDSVQTLGRPRDTGDPQTVLERTQAPGHLSPACPLSSVVPFLPVCALATEGELGG